MITGRRLGMGAATPGVSQLIQSAAAKYGIDPALLAAVANQESGMNQSRVSSAGAVGVMQLMPGTAADYGANPYDAAQNVDAGAHYLADLLARFGGDTELALAAYNAGPGTVDYYTGMPPYQETQQYVSSILARVPGTPTGAPAAADSGLPLSLTAEPYGASYGPLGVQLDPLAPQVPDAGISPVLALGIAAAAVWLLAS